MTTPRLNQLFCDVRELLALLAQPRGELADIVAKWPHENCRECLHDVCRDLPNTSHCRFCRRCLVEQWLLARQAEPLVVALRELVCAWNDSHGTIETLDAAIRSTLAAHWPTLSEEQVHVAMMKAGFRYDPQLSREQHATQRKEATAALNADIRYGP